MKRRGRIIAVAGREMDIGGWRMRSVLECGGTPPLSRAWDSSLGKQSARGLAQSKTWRAFLSLCLLPSAFCLSALAQYSIDWHTIDGGGGTSTGGVYSVSGTIGQPDAGGPMTNGQYSVTGGFWVLPTAIQTEGAPTLTIAKGSPGFANISWTPPSTNWVLQESVSLSPANWTNSISGATNPIVVPAALSTKFYRLHKP